MPWKQISDNLSKNREQDREVCNNIKNDARYVAKSKIEKAKTDCLQFYKNSKKISRNFHQLRFYLKLITIFLYINKYLTKEFICTHRCCIIIEITVNFFMERNIICTKSIDLPSCTSVNEWRALVNRISKDILSRPTKEPRPHPGSRCLLQRRKRIRTEHNASNLSFYRDIIQL